MTTLGPSPLAVPVRIRDADRLPRSLRPTEAELNYWLLQHNLDTTDAGEVVITPVSVTVHHSTTRGVHHSRTLLSHPSLRLLTALAAAGRLTCTARYDIDQCTMPVDSTGRHRDLHEDNRTGIRWANDDEPTATLHTGHAELRRRVHAAVTGALTRCEHPDEAGPIYEYTRACADCTTDAVLDALAVPS